MDTLDDFLGWGLLVVQLAPLLDPQGEGFILHVHALTGTDAHTGTSTHRHTQAQIDVHIRAHADTHTGKVTGLSVGQVSCMRASATAYQVISRNRRRPTASATSHPPGPEINTVTQSQGTA